MEEKNYDEFIKLIHITQIYNSFSDYLSNQGNKERKMQEAVGPNNDGLRKGDNDNSTNYRLLIFGNV
jgi:hypothetical protein